CARHGSTYW
nr:immunoglobulin heavy chain junction region [Mus musculus]